MITYQYKVNMTPGGIPVRCRLGQYDDDWSIVFTLYSDSGEFTVESGTTAKIRGTKRDGLGYSADATINISSKTVTVAGDKQITAVAGENIFELVLLKGTKELSTANVVFFVERAAMDAGTLVSDSQVQEILDMSADVIAASANVSTLRGNFAPAYTPGATYSMGEYVVHNNQLYRCKETVSNDSTFNSNHWTAVDVTSEQKTGLTDITEAVADSIDVVVNTDEWEIGSINQNNGINVNSAYTMRTKRWKHISPGTTVAFTGVSRQDNINRLAYAYYYDKTGAFISRAAYSSVPSNAAYVRYTYGWASASGQTVEAYGLSNLVADWSISTSSSLKSSIATATGNISTLQTDVSALNTALPETDRKLSELADSVGNTIDVIVNDSDWEIGGINQDSGANMNSVTYTMRTKRGRYISPNTSVSFTGLTTKDNINRIAYAYYYDKTGAFLSRGLYNSIPANAVFVRYTYGWASASGQTVEAYGLSNLIADWSISCSSKIESDINDINTYAMKGSGYINSAAAFVAPYDDADTLPYNTAVTYGTNYVPANAPTGFAGGSILTYSGMARGGTYGGTVQICTVKTTGKTWMRIRWGSAVTAWSSWKTIRFAEEPVVELRDFASMAMFSKIGVVGDSYSSGSITSPGGTIGRYFDLSWIQEIGRRIGAAATNYSQGGLSTKTWLTDENGLSKLLAHDPEQLYYLALGINDHIAITGGTYTLGTIDDIKEDYTQNADTFYGNYGRIIAQIQAHAPYAILMMVSITSPVSTSRKNTMNPAIQEIAEHFGLPYLYADNDPFFTSSFYSTNLANSHPVAVTYSGMAKAIERLTETFMVEHPSYFREYYGLTE